MSDLCTQLQVYGLLCAEELEFNIDIRCLQNDEERKQIDFHLIYVS